MADSVPPALERVEHNAPQRELARAILDTWPTLTVDQACALAGATAVPTVPGAAAYAGLHHVTVYGWLGRLPSRPERLVPTFKEAWDVCVALGRENYVTRCIAMSESLNDKGNAAAPAVMAKILSGFDPTFAGHAAVTVDTQRVKRIILEREGE